MTDQTAFDFLSRIGNTGNVFLRMKNEATGEIKGKTIDLSRVEDPVALSSGIRTFSEQGWSVWAMVSETKVGDMPYQTRLIWADLDWDKYPRGQAQVNELISTLPVKPSLIVESGHGNHLYWYLDQPVEPKTAQQMAKSMAWMTGGDALHAPNHKMRVPGTVNPKHLNPKSAEKGIVSATDCRIVGGTGEVFSPASFPVDQALVKVPHGLMKKLVRGPETPATTDKSAYDYQLALSLLENGLNQDEIQHLLVSYTGSGKAATEGHNKRNYVQRTVQAAWRTFGNKGQPFRPTKDTAPVSWERKTYKQLLEAPRPAFLVQDFLPHRGIALIAAPPKARKSWASMQLAHSMATGADWLGFAIPTAKRVLYVQAELPDDVVAARFEQMYGLADVENLQFIRVPSADLTQDEHLQGLLGEIQDFGAELVIIDPIANFWQGDENSASSVNVLFDKLALIQEAGCGVVLVHHSRKTQGMERITPQHMRGSSVFFARPDAVMTISPTADRFSWADFTLRAAAPRDGIRLFVGTSGEFVLEGKTSFEELPESVQSALKAGMQKVQENRRKYGKTQKDAGPITPSQEAGEQVRPDLSRMRLIEFGADGHTAELSKHGSTDRTGMALPRLPHSTAIRTSKPLPTASEQVSAGD